MAGKVVAQAEPRRSAVSALVGLVTPETHMPKPSDRERYTRWRDSGDTVRTLRRFRCWGLSRHGGRSASPLSWAMAHSCGYVVPCGDDGAQVIAARSALI